MLKTITNISYVKDSQRGALFVRREGLGVMADMHGHATTLVEISIGGNRTSDHAI